MGRLDDFVEAVTRRLRVDPAVHWDVSREIRAHLEDAAAEARARGCSDDESVEAALSAFGDEEELAEQLWQANRRRMRLRAVATWAWRLVLAPAAVAVALALCLFSVRTIQRLIEQLPDRDAIAFFAGPDPQVDPRPGLTERELFLFEHLTEDLDDAGLLVGRYPDDPIIYAHYVRLLSEQFSAVEDVPDEEFNRWLAVLDRGKEVEPDNAIYDYLKAALWMLRGSDAEHGKGICYEYVSMDPEGQVEESCGVRLIVRDADAIARGLRELYQGIGKAHCTMHAGDVAVLRTDLWRRPETLADYVGQLAHHASQQMSHCSVLRGLFRRLPACAAWLVENGQKSEAARVAAVMQRPAAQSGADSQLAIEVLVARAGFSEAMGQAPEIYRRLGLPEEAREARGRFEQAQAAWNDIWRRGRTWDEEFERRLTQEGSIFAASWIPARVQPDVWEWNAPLRRAEHVYLERLALGLMMGAFALLTLAFGVAGLPYLWRRKGGEGWLLLLFVGWRRAALVLAAAMAPLALYWAWTRLGPADSLARSVYSGFWQRVAELAAVYVLALSASMAAAYRAVRARCAEAGMDVGPAGWLNPLRRPGRALACAAVSVAGGLVAFGIAAAGVGDLVPGLFLPLVGGTGLLLYPCVFALWQMRHVGHSSPGVVENLRSLGRGHLSLGVTLIALVGLVLAGLLVMFHAMVSERLVLQALCFVAAGVFIMVLVYVFARPAPAGPQGNRLARFRRTALRSMTPLLAACLLAFALVSHGYLDRAEAHYLEPLWQSDWRWTEDIEHSMMVEYRDYLRELNQKWLAAHPPRALPLPG